MMTVDFAAIIKKLLPTGRAWVLPPGYMRSLIAGIAVEAARVADFLHGVVRESNPGTATLTQQEWFDLYGILWDPTGAISTRQAQTLARYIATGGQDISYFQRCIDQAGFNVQIVENPAGDFERLESTFGNGITVLVGPGSYYAVTYPDNDLTITANPAPGHYYAGTLGNDLNVSDTADTDAYIASTLSNALTVTENPLPHQIAWTVGDDLTVTLVGNNYKFDAASYSFVTGDIGKTCKIINSSGTEIATLLILSVDDGGNVGICELSIVTGSLSAGTITGGLWGFSTDTIIDAGDFILTAAISKFSSGDAGTESIRKIDAGGDTVAEWDIVNYASGTVVGANLSSGTSGSAAAGLWGYSTEAIIIPGEYTLDADSEKFSTDSVTRTIRINDTDGEPVALFEIMTYEDSTTVTANLTSGTAPETEVEGGAWDFSLEPVLVKDTYLLECAEDYFTADHIGGTLNVIDSVGNPYFIFEITSRADAKNAGANFTGDSGAGWWLNYLLTNNPDNEVVADGGGWAMASEDITVASYLLASQLDYFELGDVGDTLIFIDNEGSTIAAIEVSGFTDSKHVAGTLSSGTAPAGWVAGGLWGWDGESTVTQNYIFNFNVIGEINTQEEAAQLAALIQRLSPAHLAPIYDLDIKLNVYGAAVCGSGYCSAT